jgi:hypothetical protein
MPQEKNSPMRIAQLKVTLDHVKPPIWRRIQVRDDVTLYKLHQTLQIAMGWLDSHLHQFIAGGIYYGQPDPDFDVGPEFVNERRTRLNEIVEREKDRFTYEYDFGDGWTHTIVVEKYVEPEPRVRYPRCLGGKRRCPPEDVGGPWGYMGFLEAIRDEKHPEHDTYLEWLGEPFDSEEFDVVTVNEWLRDIR